MFIIIKTYRWSIGTWLSRVSIISMCLTKPLSMLTIINNYLRGVWIYILKSRTETFLRFKDWHTMVSNLHGTKLKVLRTNNGMEFVWGEFNEFCIVEGIKRHKKVTGTPQQNGLVTKMNKTILERVRCILPGNRLPKFFWGDFANTTIYLIKKNPSSTLNCNFYRSMEWCWHLHICTCQEGQIWSTC